MSIAKIGAHHGEKVQAEFDDRMALLEAKLTTLLTSAGCDDTARVARYLTQQTAEALSERPYAKVAIGLCMPIAYSPAEARMDQTEIYVKIGEGTKLSAETRFSFMWS
jgi:hypothetical protein